MAKFKMLGLRKRNTTVKSHMPGQPSVTSLDGIELVLEYVHTTAVITPQEEAKVVEAVKTFNETRTDNIFLDLDASQTNVGKDVLDSNESKTTDSTEVQKWKAKYEEAEGKRKGLQLKVNEYKGKLAKYETADSTPESKTTSSGKGKRNARA